MKKIYNAAIIGCGEIAGGYDERSGFKHAFTHAGAYKKHPRFEIKAVADIDEKRLDEFKNIWKIKTAYSDYRELFKNEEIDLLSICVPDASHYLVVKDALKLDAAKSILVEKPIASTPGEASEIIQSCENKKISIYVNNNRLWDPAHREIKKIISEGFLGDIQGGVGYYVRGIKHNGTTMINTLKFLLGKQVSGVRAFRSTASEIPGDLALDGVLQFDDGTEINVIACDKEGYGHSIFEIDLMGNQGRIKISDNGFQIKIYETAEYKRYFGFKNLSESTKYQNRLPESKMNSTLIFTLDEISSNLDISEFNMAGAKESIQDMRAAFALIESLNDSGKFKSLLK